MSEQTAWDAVSSIADAALTYWNGFMGLSSAGQPLTAEQISRLLCIIRAVSWVESNHGTGPGSAAIDPMQCANPGDAWWKELSDCSHSQDHFVLGPGLSNYDACKLPAAAVASGLTDDANVFNLDDITQGHSDPKFKSVMSYYWGIPFVIFKINKTAGDKTYQCGDLSTDRLVAGAVAYNGGGVADYEIRIRTALLDSGCLG